MAMTAPLVAASGTSTAGASFGKTAAASAIGPTTTGLFGWIGAKRARKFQREMATTAYQRDVEMWENANKYNAPEQQMQRLKEAGLNPNLVYGNGSVTGNTSTQTPRHQSYDTPVHTFVPNVLEMLSLFTDIKGKQLSNEAQSINNAYLMTNNMYDTQSKRHQSFKDMIDLGFGYKAHSKSPYNRRQQEQVKGLEMENALKKYQVEFMKTVPKEFQWIAPLIMNLIK